MASPREPQVRLLPFCWGFFWFACFSLFCFFNVLGSMMIPPKKPNQHSLELNKMSENYNRRRSHRRLRSSTFRAPGTAVVREASPVTLLHARPPGRRGRLPGRVPGRPMASHSPVVTPDGEEHFIGAGCPWGMLGVDLVT